MDQSAQSLFDVAARRRLVIRPGRERSIRNRHPWIFSGAIASESGPADAAIGDLVDAQGRRLASGFYSTHSQIRLRAIAFGDEELTPALLQQRIAEAIAARSAVFGPDTDAARLIHSEGDRLSGLIVDRYAGVLAVQITSAGLDRLRALIIEILQDLLQPSTIVIRNNVPSRKIERLSLDDQVIGEDVPDVVIRENGIRFRVGIRESQKTGFFLDQRDNRAILARVAEGRSVLNVFSYTGGFGVYAAVGGAESVEEVDISEDAIALARVNHEMNAGRARLTFTAADAFAHMRSLVEQGRRYGVVVCDPPAFAKSRGEVDRAARGYKDINLQAFRLAEAGGLVMTFSCSGHISSDLFQKIVFAAALDAHRDVSIAGRLEAGADHPISIYCPEGEYLKGLLLRVDS